MKRFLAKTLISLTICASTFAASNRVELHVWESSGTEQAFIQYAIREYKKINPRIKIVYEPVESTEARNKIELDGPAIPSARALARSEAGLLATASKV